MARGVPEVRAVGAVGACAGVHLKTKRVCYNRVTIRLHLDPALLQGLAQDRTNLAHVGIVGVCVTKTCDRIRRSPFFLLCNAIDDPSDAVVDLVGRAFHVTDHVHVVGARELVAGQHVLEEGTYVEGAVDGVTYGDLGDVALCVVGHVIRIGHVSVVILHQSLGSAGASAAERSHDVMRGNAALQPIGALSLPCVRLGTCKMADPRVLEDVSAFQDIGGALQECII